MVLLIDSQGGNVDEGLRLSSYIKDIVAGGFIIVGVALEECCSIAVNILFACSHMIAHRDSNFILHFIIFDGDVMMFYSEKLIKLAHELFKEKQEAIIAGLMTRMNLSYNDLLILMAKKPRLSSTDALTYGIIDEILPESHSPQHTLF